MKTASTSPVPRRVRGIARSDSFMQSWSPRGRSVGQERLVLAAPLAAEVLRERPRRHVAIAFVALCVARQARTS